MQYSVHFEPSFSSKVEPAVALEKYICQRVRARRLQSLHHASLIMLSIAMWNPDISTSTCKRRHIPIVLLSASQSPSHRTLSPAFPSLTRTAMPTAAIVTIMLCVAVAAAADASTCPSPSTSPASLLQGARALRKDRNDAAANACLRQRAQLLPLLNVH
jgi:hypothetical protein